MVRTTRKSSPYFFKRVWSPFSSGIGAVGNTAEIALGAVDSAGRAVAGRLNDAVGGLVGPRRGGRRRRASRKSKKAKKSRKASRKSKKSKKSQKSKKSKKSQKSRKGARKH
jgi:hypothetical protein